MTRTKLKSKSATVEATPGATKSGSQDAFRETVESIVVAFVLAFLFRTFIAEAFVIPTGSMAPTLFGRHKDVICPQCGQAYEVGASSEMDDEGVRLQRRIKHATCPNCRYQCKAKSLPVFKGDRILVNKFPYELAPPSRWDVCVFKFPEDPERNYIKRMVGLPGETIRIVRGDVYARREDAADFKILRKDDPNKQLAIQILVSDDAHPPRELLKQGWPERWSGMIQDQAAGSIDGWSEAAEAVQSQPDRRAYRIAAKETTWLRYRNLVPTTLDWQSVEDGQKPAPNPRPQLVTDFYAYNTFNDSISDRDQFWVGDLTVSGRVVVSSVEENSAVVLELVEGLRRYQCEIDLQTGLAKLTHNDDLNPQGATVELATAATPMSGPGTYDFDFANVDDRLCLWINGRLIPYGAGAEYHPPALTVPQDGDLMPVGLAARQAQVEFSRLVVKRDIYYRAETVANDERGSPWTDKVPTGEAISEVTMQLLREALSQPAEYAQIYAAKAGPVEFSRLGPDEFFVMGDNSPQSQDSRLWSNRRGAVNRHAVPRNAFVGKAFLIYWPHGIPFLNDGQGYPIAMHSTDGNTENYPAYTFPFYPQFGRLLKRIR